MPDIRSTTTDPAEEPTVVRTTDPRTGEVVESNRAVDRDAADADDNVRGDVVPGRTTDVDLQERRFGGIEASHSA